MCDFCKDIPEIRYNEDLQAETSDWRIREKLVLVKEEGVYRFYGFNKYHYEDDACYGNVQVRFCPVCGREIGG